MHLIVELLILLSASCGVLSNQLDTVYEWNYIEYQWPSTLARQQAIDNGTYHFARVLPMDVDVSRDGRVFVSFLGMDGVPATLGVVSNQRGPSGPLIQPYPNLGWFERGSCNAIQNVYRIAAYLADPVGRGLIVWKNGRLTRLENPIFNPNPNATNIVVGNRNMTLRGGIVAMDLSPQIFPGESRFLYFHSMASYDLYYPDTASLKRANSGSELRFQGQQNLLPSNAPAHAFASDGTLFTGLTREIAIACWNRYNPMRRDNMIDECNRMWVLDAGFLEVPAGTKNVCEAQLVVFDLNTDRLLQVIKIPDSIAKNQFKVGMLANPIVETSGPQCEYTTVRPVQFLPSAFFFLRGSTRCDFSLTMITPRFRLFKVYMADVLGEGLVVYNDNKIYRLSHSSFLYDSSLVNVTTGKHRMTLGGGILGMDLSPSLFPGEARHLYYRPLVSLDLFAVHTSQLRGKEILSGIPFATSTAAKNILTSHAVGQAFSSEGTLFLGNNSSGRRAIGVRQRRQSDSRFAGGRSRGALGADESLHWIPAGQARRERSQLPRAQKVGARIDRGHEMRAAGVHQIRLTKDTERRNIALH
ncbi:unnamed protein product [Trichogramma brassicae]|uniref:Uncharacterized protein n=1 Tax=Trichogramma brassicae TaxID=86971 RepID=A0A6H5IU99_9HYME|nr:unnamed protein product [Trichogramma brassicae]